MADDMSPVDEFIEGADVPSPKAARRKARKVEREAKQARRMPKPIEPRTPTQADYINSLYTNELTFAVGPAGVGKTYVAARLFGEWIAAGRIEKLYLSRPNIAKAKHKNGFLPGSLEEKTAPWLVPIMDGLKDSMGGFDLDRLRKEKKIEEVPFEFMQGRTFKNAAVLVDEAENLDLDDFYMTLTRLGDDVHAAFCGDIYQARIPNSGMADAIKMARRFQMESVGVIEFGYDDIVRGRQARQWAKAFAAHWGHADLQDAIECDKQVIETFSHDTMPAFLKGA